MTRRLCDLFGSIGLALLSACAVDAAGGDGDYVTAQAETLELAQACNDNDTAVYQRVSGNGNPGDIVRCSRGRSIGADEITQKLNSFMTPFNGAKAKFAVQLYRISYRTQRLGNQADLATALVALPGMGNSGRGNAQAEPSTTSSSDAAAAAKPNPPSGDDDLSGDDDFSDDVDINSTPLVVFAHGTAPWGNACATSRLDPVTAMDADEESGTLLALASRGFPVVAPDYAGYVEGSTVAGYLLSEDEAHSVLDSTRAMAKFLKTAPSKVVIVGHSQGGHAALSAQKYAGSYGMAGQLKGVAVFAPFWAPARGIGLIINPLAGYTVQSDPDQIKFAIEYFHTHAENYDGVGTGLSLFQPDKQALVQQLIASCALTTPPPSGLGTTPDTFFDTTFDDAVGACGVDREACDAAGLASTWETRFKADRPNLNASGAPIVLWQGKADATIFPELAKCGIDKINADLPNGSAAKFTLCGDKAADHQSILSRRTAWVRRWIKARTLGKPEPKTCKGEEALTDSGTTLSCFAPLGNTD